MAQSFFEKNASSFYFVFRVIIAITFFLHGWMKVGMIQAGTLPLVSLMGLACVIEVLGSILLILGLQTRTVAGIAALEMLYAFITVHVMSGGINPLVNKGEPALLFFAAFLVLLAYGPGKWSIDGSGMKKK